MARAAQEREEIENCRQTLQAWIKPGDTVYTIVTSIARSGMSRTMVLLIIRDGRIANISYLAAKTLSWRVSRDRDAIVVGGAGMDMGFHVVDRLAFELGIDTTQLHQQWL